MSEKAPTSSTTGVPAPADARAEVKDFLTTRRAKITPQMAGLPVVGGNRRVPGLRREEVAMLAGVSVDYYTRLERGRVAAHPAGSPGARGAATGIRQGLPSGRSRH